MVRLMERGTGTCCYPGIQLRTLFHERGFTSCMFPFTEHLCHHIVTLPISPAMEARTVGHIVTVTNVVLLSMQAAK